MMRSLSGMENIVYALEKINNGGCFFALKCRESINEEMLRRSLLILQEKRPFLKAKIVKNKFLINKKHASNLYIHKTENCSLFKTIETLLSTSFDENHLYKFHLIQTVEGSHIVATFNHVIIDGVSGLNLIIDLLSILENLYYGNSANSIKKQSLSDPVDPYFEHGNSKNIFNIAANEVVAKKTTIEHYQFSEEKTALFIDFSKKNKISVHNLICAISCTLLGSLVKSLDPREKTILCLNPINMRPYLPIKIDNTQMGYYLSRIDTIYRISENYNVIAIAKDLQNQLKNGINEQQYNDIFYAANDISRNCTDLYKISDNILQKKPCVLISNMGAFNIDYSFNHFKIDDLHYGATIHNIIENPLSFGAMFVTTNGKMSINFSYLNSPVTNIFIKDTIKKIILSIEECSLKI